MPWMSRDRLTPPPPSNRITLGEVQVGTRSLLPYLGRVDMPDGERKTGNGDHSTEDRGCSSLYLQLLSWCLIP